MNSDSDVRVTKVSRTYNVYRGTSPATENRTQTVKTTKKIINATTGQVIKEEVDVKSNKSENQRVVNHVQELMERDEARFLARLRELEDALDSERDGRVRAEKLLAELQFRYDQLSDTLEEQGGVTTQQIEINKKRESEVNKLRKDIEIINVQFEQTEQSLRKRHNEAVNDLNDQIEHLTKAKTRIEKEKNTLVVELDGLSGTLDAVSKAKDSAESKLHASEAANLRLKVQVDDMSKTLADLTSLKTRLTQENFDLQHRLQELDSANAALAKAKAQLQAQNDDLKRNLDDETRQRQNLQVQLSGLQSDYDNLNARLEEEIESGNVMRAQLSKVNSEYSALKSRFDKEIQIKIEEIEEIKRRLTIRITELEDSVETYRTKCSSLEKNKAKLLAEIKEITIELENTQIIVQDLTKRNRQLENENASLTSRLDDLGRENAQLRNDKATLEQECYRLRVANAELTERNDNLARENKSLSDQLREANQALKDANRELTELRALRIQLENERDSLAAALKDTEDALRDAENKLAAATAALDKLRSDMEARLREKDEEIENIRRSSQRVIEELQRTLVEVETRMKTEITRLKKKYELQIRELEAALDNANRANAEYLKQIKSLQSRVKELEVLLEEERRSGDEARNALSISERKRLALAQELEDARSLLEAAERARKNAQDELVEVNVRISEMSIQITALINDKRRLEQDMAALQSDLDDALNAQHAAEENAARLANENARLADELRQEQENYKNAESLRKQLEIEIREITVRLEEAEAFAQREGKRMVAKLQARLRDLEAELEAEQRKVREAVSNQRKAERFYKELMMQTEEERKQLIELQSLNESLTIRIRTYKRQIEEAEDVANLTLNKYRKAQALIEEAETRADSAEKNLQSVRRARSMSVTREITRVVKQGHTKIQTVESSVNA